MSDSDIVLEEEVKVVLEVAEIVSSEEPPPEEWSSLFWLAVPLTKSKGGTLEDGSYDLESEEVCLKYIAASDSSVFRHPYFNYPCIVNPGIEDALLQPIPETVYPDDGQELYLALCKEMGTLPVQLFYRNLLAEVIDLRYYGISPDGIRPMAMSLKNNTFVKVLDLTDNWINRDGCYHLGEMVITNNTLREINLTGCRIGPIGAQYLMENMPLNKSLYKLNLSKNQLGDEGVEYISKAIFFGAEITYLNLSYNNLTTKSAALLAEAFETNNILTFLDLSWNSLLAPGGVNALSVQLRDNTKLVEVNLSWNALTARFSNAIKNILLSPNLRYFNLSNNKLENEAISVIKKNITEAKKLEYLNLSNNPLKPDDALGLLLKLKVRKVKVNELLLDNVCVSAEFREVRDEILKLKYRKDAIITHGDVREEFQSSGPDMRDIVLRRAEVLCSKPAKKAVDIGVLILTLYKYQKEPMFSNELNRYFKINGAYQLNDELIEEMAMAFPGPKKGKGRTVNLNAMVDYIHRKWPDKEPIRTPPPEPEPEQIVKPKKGKKK